MSHLVALASAIQRAEGDGVRSAMAENLFSYLEEASPGAALLCASLLRGLGTPEAAEIGEALLNARGAVTGPLELSARPRQVDLVVLAIKPPELDACLAVFGVAPLEEPVPLGASGLCGWFTEWMGRRVLITMAGAAGNVQTAVALGSLWNSVEARTAVLVGMAAGVADKVEVGDVVIAEMVCEYEFARMMKRGPQYQPRYFDVEESLIRSAELLPRRSRRWAEECREIVRSSERPKGEETPSSESIDSWHPEIYRGVVLA